MKENECRIAVLSDTHGLLRDSARKELEGSDLILHAGDIGHPRVLDELREIGTVLAVRGNVDHGPWTTRLRATEHLEVCETSIYLLHNLGELDLVPESAGIHIVVYGHSHQPSVEQRGPVLYFNPGSAGPRRLRLPVSMGRLTISRGIVTPELIPLRD